MKKEIQETKLHAIPVLRRDHLRSTSGIISGSVYMEASLLVAIAAFVKSKTKRNMMSMLL